MYRKNEGPKSRGKVAKLIIQFSEDLDEHYHYRPNEIIEGHVIVKIIDGPLSVRHLAIRFLGSGTSGWMVENSSESLRAQEVYLDEIVQIIPRNSEKVLPVGEHLFPFKYLLPGQLPSSFIGKYGSVTYISTVQLKESTKFGLGSAVVSEPFLILNRYKIPQLFVPNPHKMTAKKRVWKGLSFGNVTSAFGINKVVFSPGEEAVLNAEVVNTSSKQVIGLHALLVMTSVYSAGREKKVHAQVVSRKSDKWSLTKGEGRRWKDTAFLIPNYAPESILENCDIIDIKYNIVFKVNIKGRKDLKISIPIEIYATGVTKANVKMPEKYGETYKSIGGLSLALDKETIENTPVDELFAMKLYTEEEKGIIYERPIDNGTLRINPLYRANLSEFKDAVTTKKVVREDESLELDAKLRKLGETDKKLVHATVTVHEHDKETGGQFVNEIDELTAF